MIDGRYDKWYIFRISTYTTPSSHTVTTNFEVILQIDKAAVTTGGGTGPRVRGTKFLACSESALPRVIRTTRSDYS